MNVIKKIRSLIASIKIYTKSANYTIPFEKKGINYNDMFFNKTLLIYARSIQNENKVYEILDSCITIDGQIVMNLE